MPKLSFFRFFSTSTRLSHHLPLCSHHLPLRSSYSRAFTSSSPNVWQVDNPYSDEIICEIPVLDDVEAIEKVRLAERTFREFRKTPLEKRQAIMKQFAEAIQGNKQQIAIDISKQMGKPITQAEGEINGLISRVHAMNALAPEALAEEIVKHGAQDNIVKRIVKDPVGVVLVLSPYNYPLLTAINAIAGAVLSGCTVLLKHSDRTPLCSNHFEQAFKATDAPEHLLQALHINHETIPLVVSHPAIQQVQFTGSVAGGRAVYQAVAATRFIDVGLELGGKDPAYVAEDADLDYAIEQIVDGGMYNAGQSCCAIERVYVHKDKYQRFLEGVKHAAEQYKLGNPLSNGTNMGPIAQPKHPNFIANQIHEAVTGGARVLTGGKSTHDNKGKGRFFQPTIVADCTQQMGIMTQETFGPVLAISSVQNDADAIRKMNDSVYGLTASVWTSDVDRATKLASDLDAGTVYLNRSDYLDPYLPWSGRKDSGKGGSFGLSHYGFLPFIRTKGINFRTKITK